jgi:hypothetical protein
MLNGHVSGCFLAFGNERKPSNSLYRKSVAATPDNNGTDADSHKTSGFTCAAHIRRNRIGEKKGK